MRVSPKRLAWHLKAHGVTHGFVAGWDSPTIDPFNGRSDFVGVLLHHTAGVDSLRWIVHTNPYAPVRACHFLVNRSGLVEVVSGVGAYHAGAGGPWTFPKGPFVPRDQGNRFLYGIEIESLGEHPLIDGSKGGMTVEQVVSTGVLCASLLDAMKRGPGSVPVNRVIRHQDWTRRKVDVRQHLVWWHQVVGVARKAGKNYALAAAGIREFVGEHPRGML